MRNAAVWFYQSFFSIPVNGGPIFNYCPVCMASWVI